MHGQYTANATLVYLLHDHDDEAEDAYIICVVIRHPKWHENVSIVCMNCGIWGGNAWVAILSFVRTNSSIEQGEQLVKLEC